MIYVGFLFCIAFKYEDFKVTHDYQEWVACKLFVTILSKDNQPNHFSEICGPMRRGFRSGECCFETNGAIIICQM